MTGAQEPDPSGGQASPASGGREAPVERVLFDTWFGILRTVLAGILGYAALVFILRLSGKRTLSTLNAFDLVVTVALGSTLATVLLNKSVAVAEGAVAFGLLAGMQYLVSYASLRSRVVRRLIKSEPSLLVRRGVLLEDAMRRERISRDEILEAARSAQLGDLSRIEAIVLETDGTLSVIPGTGEDPGRDSTLQNLPGSG